MGIRAVSPGPLVTLAEGGSFCISAITGDIAEGDLPGDIAVVAEPRRPLPAGT